MLKLLLDEHISPAVAAGLRLRHDNYISLLPGETHEIEIEYPTTVGKGLAQLTLRGRNLVPRAVAIAESK
jgi:hypothetical protein